MDLRTGTKELIRDLNIALVMDYVRRRQSASRVEIAEGTGLGRSTVTGVVSRLIREGFLTEIGPADSTLGRRPVLLELNSHARFVIGAKLAPQRVEVAICDLLGRVVARCNRSLSLQPTPGEAVTAIEMCVRDLLQAQGVSPERVLGAGLAMPGIVDTRSGRAVRTTFFGWADVPLREELEGALGVPVFLENDSNAFALAEHAHGAGRGYNHLVCVTVGVGIGAGLIVGGQLYRGAFAGAGEIGHTTIDEDGPICSCGNSGCLEALASDHAIERAARHALEAGLPTAIRDLAEGNLEQVTRDLVVRAAIAGDRLSRGLVQEAGEHLGVGLTNAVNLLNPERIVVGGEAVVQAGALLLGPLEATLRRRSFSVLADQLVVTPATLGQDAWVVGAAMLVVQEFFRPPIARDATSGPFPGVSRVVPLNER